MAGNLTDEDACKMMHFEEHTVQETQEHLEDLSEASTLSVGHSAAESGWPRPSSAPRLAPARMHVAISTHRDGLPSARTLARAHT